MNYYRLKDDIDFPNRWYLGDILEVENWDLLSLVPNFNSDELDIELYQDGEEMDFTLTEVYGVPVVSQKIKQELEEFAEVKFIPLRFAEKSCSSSYYAMVILSIIECVDEDRSNFQKFEQNDPVRSDKAGEYRAFITLRLKPDNIVSTDIFRLKKFEIAIIVSERVRNKLEAIGATGLDLSLVV